MRIDTPSHLSDTELLVETKRLAHCERGASATLIAHMAEVEARSLHLAAGFATMFPYCTEVLRLSECEAFNRIEAARAARRFPQLLEMLAEGSLNLTTLRLVAPRLTEQNRHELLAEAGWKSKSKVQELLARHAPRPDVPESIRKLPALRGAANSVEPAAVSVGARPVAALEVSVTPPPARPPRPVATPLAPDRYQITFTGSGDTREMLDLAKDTLRHAVPDVDTEAVVNRALRALLDELARSKFAATKRPRVSRGDTGLAAGSRYVPASVKRAVWIRDRGRCAFIAANGRRCNDRGFLEFHHVAAYAKGGQATVENIALRCRAHNGYEADLEFGQRRPGGEWNTSAAGRALVPERVAGERSLSSPG